MGAFHIIKGGYLFSAGTAPDGLEPEGAILGDPPGVPDMIPPHAGAKWHVGDCCWHDCRAESEKVEQAKFDVQASRHAAYPPVGDQLDALWKMIAAMDSNDPHAREMLAKIIAVKTAIPKPA